MEDLNLHFTGDIHAIGAANNLLAAMLEAHLLHGNALGIDPLSVSWRRCLDINDRALRDVVVGLGGKANGYPRQAGLRHHRRLRGDGDRRRRPRPARPAPPPRRDHRRADVRGRAGHGRAAPRRGRDDRPVQGRAQAEPRADPRGPAGARALRAVRQHRARQQLARGRPRGAQARRDRRHRGGVRLGHGDGEVPQHRLPCGRAAAERGRARRDRARARAPRRRAGRRRGGDRARRGEPRPPPRHRRRLRAQGRRSRQPVPGRRQREIELVRSLALEAARTPPRSTTASSAAAPVQRRSRRRWSTRPSRSRASVTPTS